MLDVATDKKIGTKIQNEVRLNKSSQHFNDLGNASTYFASYLKIDMNK